MNYYERAIKILMELKETEHREILLKIAQKNPWSIVRAFEEKSGVEKKGADIDDKRLRDECLSLVSEGGNGKIRAVKHYRAVSGAPLKDSLEAVNSMIEESTYKGEITGMTLNQDTGWLQVIFQK